MPVMRPKASDNQPGPDQPPQAGRPRRWGAALVGVLTALLCLWLVLRWRDLGFQWEVFAATLRHISGLWLGAAAAFAMLTYVGRALRWQVLIRPVRPKPVFWNLLSATAVGFTAIVMFGRAGELVRPYLIAVKEKVSFSSQVAAWLLERIYDLITALLIFGFALARVRSSGATVGPGLTWVLQAGGYAVAVLCGVCLTVLIVLRQFSEPMRRRLLDGLDFLPPTYHRKVEQIVTAFMRGVESTKSHAFVLQLVFYSLLEWLLIILCQVCIFRAFPETAALSLTDVIIFVGFISFGCVVQIPGVGGGMQLVAVVILTELFGMSLEVAGGIALVLWLVTFVVIVPVGLLLAFREGLHWGKLRHLEEEPSL